MANIIFRYIDGKVRPIPANGINTTNGQQSRNSLSIVIPKQKLSLEHFKSAISYTIPNATCHKCGARVFYYEHVNGSRVLFDELGPPWPKHPCYETNQAGKSKGTRNLWPDSKPNWIKQGWLPLIYKSHVLQKSGKVLSFQAKTDSYSVKFEIALTTLRQHQIKPDEVKSTLMMVKVNNAEAIVQLHNGNKLIEVKGSIIQPGVTDIHYLTAKHLNKLTKLDVSIQLKTAAERWLVEFLYLGQKLEFSFKLKAFEYFAQSPENLNVLLGNVTKNGNQVFYFIDKTNLRFLTAVRADGSPKTDTTKPETSAIFAKSESSQTKRLSILSITADTTTSKVVLGKIDEDEISLSVPNRLFRFGETDELFLSKKLHIFVRKVVRDVHVPVDYALFIAKSDDISLGSPRGFVSKWQSSKIEVAKNVKPLAKTESNKEKHRAEVTFIDFTEKCRIQLELLHLGVPKRLLIEPASIEIIQLFERLITSKDTFKLYVLQKPDTEIQLKISNGTFIIGKVKARLLPIQALTGKNSKTTRKTKVTMEKLEEIIQGNQHVASNNLGAALISAALKQSTERNEK